MLELLLILFIGFILDLFIGDPNYAFHPIRLMGRSIAPAERFLRSHGLGGRGGGIILALILEISVLVIYIALRSGFGLIHPVIGWCFDIYMFFSCIALRDLTVHIDPVITALDSDNLTGARMAVSKVVGRDVDYLDRQGVIRSAVETMSESFVDGFLTPLFWLLAGSVSGYLIGLDPVLSGMILVLFSKVASTLDSMVGYKTIEYARFGWAGARLDDLVNFLPARLSLIMLFAGAWISSLGPVNGFKVALSDRLKHDSPNAAHSESFVAGALNIRLGGPTRYRDGLKNKPWLGEGYPDPGIKQIKETRRLITSSAWVSIIVSLGVIILIRYL